MANRSFFILILLHCAGSFWANSLQAQCKHGNLTACLKYLDSVKTGEISSSDLSVDMALRYAAEKGHVQAMFNLAVRTMGSVDNPVDIKTSIDWFKQASQHGDALAALNLGLIYDHGIGVDVDFVKARMWYGKAADSGNPEALFNLAVFLDEGLGGPVNKAAAMRAYMLAAERGHGRAAYNLALLLGRGDGVARNWFKALQALRDSKKYGYQPAQQLLEKWEKFEKQ